MVLVTAFGTCKCLWCFFATVYTCVRAAYTCLISHKWREIRMPWLLFQEESMSRDLVERRSHSLPAYLLSIEKCSVLSGRHCSASPRRVISFRMECSLVFHFYSRAAAAVGVGLWAVFMMADHSIVLAQVMSVHQLNQIPTVSYTAWFTLIITELYI